MPLALLTDWWNELTIAKQIFYGIGLISGLVSVILIILGFFGLDHHHATDALGAGSGDMHDPNAGLSPGIFSLKPVTGFFLGFGWGGGLALDSGRGIPVATLIALGCGTLIMAIIVVLFRAIMSLRSDGTMQIERTVGCVGTVYLTLPPSRASGGQVVVNFSGRQETFAALNTSDRSIPSGDKVRVVQIVDSHTLLVEPLA